MAVVDLEKLKVIKGEDYLTMYQFGSFTAKNYFCSKCGIYTHHLRRANPKQYAFNVGCVDEIDVCSLTNVEVFEGKDHPSDK